MAVRFSTIHRRGFLPSVEITRLKCNFLALRGGFVVVTIYGTPLKKWQWLYVLVLSIAEAFCTMHCICIFLNKTVHECAISQ